MWEGGMTPMGLKRPGAPLDEPPTQKGKGANGEAFAGEGAATGEVRMATAEQAMAAVQNLDGSMLGGGRISVVADRGSKDGTKISVRGIPDGVEWQVLKEHFGQAGEVKFAAVNKIPFAGPAGTCEGEVRYQTAEELQAAMSTINGSDFGGSTLTVKVDSTSKDGTKCFIYGIPLGTQWQELKDHCAQAGTVAYCNVISNSGDLGEGEIRYDDEAHAQQALSLDGSIVCGAQIKVQLDPARPDKLRIYGLPPRCQWQELKDHFATIGTVAFANVKGGKGGKGGKGDWGGGMDPWNMQMMMNGMSKMGMKGMMMKGMMMKGMWMKGMKGGW